MPKEKKRKENKRNEGSGETWRFNSPIQVPVRLPPVSAEVCPFQGREGGCRGGDGEARPGLRESPVLLVGTRSRPIASCVGGWGGGGRIAMYDVKG